MDIKELNERIEQLTNLVITSEETINQLKETLKSVEQERDRLADQRRENEPKFERVEKGERYFTITGELKIIRGIEGGYPVDDNKYSVNNYFYTEERAQEVANKINVLLKLERLHDIYCPNYKPNWDNSTEDKWRIYYNHNAKKWICANYSTVSFPPESSFPTEEIAQRVCDILNEEETENHDNS